MKKKQEAIKMMEETFIRKHAKKIFVAGTVVSIAGLIYISKKYGVEINFLNNKLELASNKLVEAGEIALRSLYREKANAEFEIDSLKEYISKLDSSYNINIFVKIPEAEKRIEELLKFIREIDMDIKKIEG